MGYDVIIPKPRYCPLSNIVVPPSSNVFPETEVGKTPLVMLEKYGRGVGGVVSNDFPLSPAVFRCIWQRRKKRLAFENHSGGKKSVVPMMHGQRSDKYSMRNRSTPPPTVYRCTSRVIYMMDLCHLTDQLLA